MALTFKDLLGNPKPLAITIVEGRDPLNVTYFPEFLSEEFESKAKALADGIDAAKGLAELVYPIISDWDIIDQPYSREALASTPSTILSMIVTAIMEDARPN